MRKQCTLDVYTSEPGKQTRRKVLGNTIMKSVLKAAYLKYISYAVAWRFCIVIGDLLFLPS